MSAPNAPPSRDPAVAGSMAGMISFVLQKFLQNTDDMLPAQVLEYNRATNRATIQPLISMVTTDDNIVQRAPIENVPVFRLGGGNGVVSCNLIEGNTGWLKANDRDISLYKQSPGMTAPNTDRKHAFEDSMFFPDPAGGVTISEDDLLNLVIQNLAGTSKISIADTYIRMLSAAVGIGGIPNAHAILDLQSTTQAFIFPRMTTSEKLAIPDPVPGMAVFDTSENALSVYNGSWS